VKASLRNRVKRLFEELVAAEKEVDCVAIASSAPDPNFLYFLGLSTGVFENSVLLLSPHSLQAVVPRLELNAVPRGVEAFSFSSPEEKKSVTKKILGQFNAVGFDFKSISHENYLLLRSNCKKMVDVSKELALTRAVKEAIEVKAMRAAARLTDKVIAGVIGGLREGVSEQEAAAEIVFCFAEKSASPAFESICAFGRNSAVPHHLPSKKQLKKGEIVLIDAGARLNGYCADLTRTIVFGRRPSFAQYSLLEVVRQAREIVVDKIRPGVQASELHCAVSEFFGSRGFAGGLIHSLGHSIGLQVHDGLRIHAKSDFVLREGMVFALEPALYFPRIGGVRLEEDVLVTRKGCRVL